MIGGAFRAFDANRVPWAGQLQASREWNRVRAAERRPPCVIAFMQCCCLPVSRSLLRSRSRRRRTASPRASRVVGRPVIGRWSVRRPGARECVRGGRGSACLQARASLSFANGRGD